MLKKIVQSLADSAIKLSKPTNPSRSTIVFNHIPKTAGMSFHTFIKNNLPNGTLLELYAPENRERLQALTDEEKSSTSAIVGHLPFSFFADISFPHEVLHVTILRDPVDRIVSYYHYIKNSRSHYLHDLISDSALSFREFMERRATTELDNLQVRYLATTDCWNLPFGACSTDLLEQAKENLATRFALFGLQEEFQETIARASQAFGFRDTSNPEINRTPERPAVSEIDADDAEFARTINELDVALYDFARQLFYERADHGRKVKETTP